MNTDTVAKIYQYHAHVCACMARIEAMKAHNQTSERKYTEEAFDNEANTIESFAEMLRNII